ncbi:bifunctional phosphoribosylaminoimidazolecarboxamide formyltransferase/IMP cyclohydrolase [Natranaerofaba carboxydovora]|uniref:bifunctional phosphoribosylaminoimidazolecarboxamide formyltransferase/IMP cyclohydrolase n=1 Tax=Natranaerofaba carboxydovora TaxID=2742683 RepID=UPI001F12A873|nr:bifunctional phosphoribosylaminoimidazolecarboxamide formyltransferase/IMP cyclohydrolase [Natranaerofaba carboxydovora]UMZ74536.1 Bifunctional purine biosynthesis protein PurH [Natranaerofaba carboxydovora]
MSDVKEVKRALISVSDKSGLVEFASKLADQGVEIISTGGTARKLKENDIPHKEVSEITSFPEILGGRVKTLHPYIHVGILAKEDEEHKKQLEEHGISYIDLVAINLYPFEETVSKPDVTMDDALENIDIGGPTMIRASAKNWPRVSIVVDPGNYSDILKELDNHGGIRESVRKELALKAFQHTNYYDSVIVDYLSKNIDDKETDTGEDDAEVFKEKDSIEFFNKTSLRYGENPHQNAAFYHTEDVDLRMHQGKELSFNNLNDTEAALNLVKEFTDPCVVAVKHTNPCGVGVSDDLLTAYRKAYDSDPVSIFGGIVALNRPCSEEVAEAITEIFVEVVIAPQYSREALEVFKKKPDIRVLETDYGREGTKLDIKPLTWGYICQEKDNKTASVKTWEQKTGGNLSEDKMKDLEIAYKVVKHVKSNAIVLVKDGQTVGVGAGQMKRVGSADIAIKEAGEKAKGSVMASDAFFPFNDTVQQGVDAGVSAIVQPGGSKRDEDSIKLAEENNIAMFFTGTRHFKH